MDNENTLTCCFCHKDVDGEGNNPDPAAIDEGSVCCDWCFYKIVLPARYVIQELIKAANGEPVVQITIPDFGRMEEMKIDHAFRHPGETDSSPMTCTVTPRQVIRFSRGHDKSESFRAGADW